MLTSECVNRKAASAYLLEKWELKRSVNYLAKLALVGGGPAFRKAGRDPLYTSYTEIKRKRSVPVKRAFYD
jgi:hypothetical protein